MTQQLNNRLWDSDHLRGSVKETTLTDSMDLSLSRLQELVMDRETCPS